MSYPTLVEMGIENPGEITSYTIRHQSRRKDLLDIYYKRKKGSLRAVRRTYEFGRAIKTVVTDSGNAVMDDTYEISPLLLTARSELDQLLAAGSSTQDVKTRVLIEIEELKASVSDGDKSDHIVEKLNAIQKQLSEL